MNGLPFILIVLAPLAFGPAPPTTQRSTAISVALCDGGSITIPLGRDAPAPGPEPCKIAACHAGCLREEFDPSQ